MINEQTQDTRNIRRMVSAVLWCVVLGLVGSLLIAAGIAMVAGLGWGLVALGVVCLGVSNLVRVGLSRG